MRTLRAAAATLALLGAGAAACLDATPVTVSNAAPVDAAAEGAAGALAARCNACLAADDDAGPGCGNETRTCDGFPTCRDLVACARERLCFEQGSLGALEACGLPCALDAGIGPGDPSFVALTAVFSCSVGTCGPACGLAEAGN